ncbi:unnamed protein product [Phytomonas sp. Hart1]|nr:unnamed protein product [Phytomonas sp. Hart1]|eukprot:CCW66401.1 unnamed protein product [Phytomonas sp. isolate Hart1]
MEKSLYKIYTKGFLFSAEISNLSKQNIGRLFPILLFFLIIARLNLSLIFANIAESFRIFSEQSNF